jgi:hypothetical protein
LVVRGASGILLSLLEHMGWGYERILGRVGENFRVTPDLRWEMASRLDSGMISGVEMWPLGKPFQIYLVLAAQRMLLFQLTWSFMLVPISEM